MSGREEASIVAYLHISLCTIARCKYLVGKKHLHVPGDGDDAGDVVSGEGHGVDVGGGREGGHAGDGEERRPGQHRPGEGAPAHGVGLLLPLVLRVHIQRAVRGKLREDHRLICLSFFFEKYIKVNFPTGLLVQEEPFRYSQVNCPTGLLVQEKTFRDSL